MISEIKLANFKIFKEETSFKLSKINLLTGINGRGKSTLLQSLLLMKQSTSLEIPNENLLLNGYWVEIGQFSDLKNRDVPIHIPIYMSFRLEKDDKIEDEIDLEYFFNGEEENNKSLKMNRYAIKKCISNEYKYDANLIDKERNIYYDKVSNSKTEIVDFQPYKSELKRLKLELSPLFDEIYYVSADRLGPQKFYDNYNPQDFIHTGKKGEYTAQVIATHKNVQINDVRSNNEAETQNLIDQASFWLSEILDTPNLQIKIDDANPYINILTFVINGKEFRPHNVGFGFSYTLPIIISGLIAEKRSILIIENPEAHLHPKAQTELIKFLTLVAEAGVQVFIESHSDHILNGLRVAIKQELIKPKNVSVLYFYGKNNIEIANPKIDKDGRIDQWPDGFFDEWDNNLMLLM